MMAPNLAWGPRDATLYVVPLWARDLPVEHFFENGNIGHGATLLSRGNLSVKARHPGEL
jgi:hypothetical protein